MFLFAPPSETVQLGMVAVAALFFLWKMGLKMPKMKSKTKSTSKTSRLKKVAGKSQRAPAWNGEHRDLSA
jgi:hypothetical protein